jgi:hypothetical protein
MDMKRILQALDGVSTKPVEGANDMKKFLQVVTEGASPHKVALPVQMAMQHYQQPVEPVVQKSHIKTSVRKFFREVEQQTAEQTANEQSQKRQLINQYASTIAERVLMKENKDHDDRDKTGWNYQGNNAKILRVLNKADAVVGSGTDNDVEKLAALVSNLDDTATKQQDTIQQQQATIEKQNRLYQRQQQIQAGMERRFRELNDKVASGEISDQDAAQSAKEIEKHGDKHMKSLDHDDHHEKDTDDTSHELPNIEVPKTKTKTAAVAPQAPASNVVPMPTAKTLHPATQPGATVPAGSTTARLAGTSSTSQPPANTNMAVTGALTPDQLAAASRLSKALPSTVHLRRNQQPAAPVKYSPEDLALKKMLDQQKVVPIRKSAAANASQVRNVAEDNIPRAVFVSGKAILDTIEREYFQLQPTVNLSFGTHQNAAVPRERIKKFLIHYAKAKPEVKTRIENEFLTDRTKFLAFLDGIETLPTPKLKYTQTHKKTKHLPKNPDSNPAQQELPLPPVEPEQGELFEQVLNMQALAAKAKAMLDQGMSEQQVVQALVKAGIPERYAQQAVQMAQMMEEDPLGHFAPSAGPGMGNYIVDETPIEMDPSEPNNPLIHGHQKANSMHLADRIRVTRSQLKELAELADRNDLLAWEEICKKAKGGLFMGLEQNLEQIRHGIEQLAAKRRQGGINSRGIDKNIGESAVIKPKKKTSVCKTGQVQTGMQTKDGKLVPKCSVKISK